MFSIIQSYLLKDNLSSLQHWCFPGKFKIFLKTGILWNAKEQLLVLTLDLSVCALNLELKAVFSVEFSEIKAVFT